jgi:hypothetical protein
MLRDPVPYLIKGDADFVSTLEIRYCPDPYPSVEPNIINWQTIEPNTGLFSFYF